ncbi:hypothetical protein LVD15_13630 [Fulvivirga maritima]|uniref:hypothetical protein n=1 Tax=Fulvivirga maritima TaxID=2904247 RepID=UPI001F3FF3E0|nr:hypothetical protein [Fulvivirga maritima]UII29422.1 hypothetical protein LVD15_13630 [Fulvivirga maritima]
MRPGKGKKIALVILAVLAFIALFGYIVMTLWNWLVPDLFNGPTVTYVQAIGLLVLCKLLFGGFHGKGGPKDRWKEKWRSMSPEQREGLKRKFAAKWKCDSHQKEPTDSAEKC